VKVFSEDLLDQDPKKTPENPIENMDRSDDKETSIETSNKCEETKEAPVIHVEKKQELDLNSDDKKDSNDEDEEKEGLTEALPADSTDSVIV